MDKDKLLEKIMSRILVTNNGCWEWQGAKCGPGYGEMCIANPENPKKRRSAMVHRLVYEFLKEPIPEGKVLNHLCNNPPCCNPDHLEAVSPKENLAYMRALERHSNGEKHSQAIIAGHTAKLLPKPPNKRRQKRIYSHAEILEELNKHTIKTSEGCWFYIKNGKSPYPKVHGGTDPITGKTISHSAHRISYEIHKGPIPADMQVCHTCDNHKCWNPEHLWLGTTQENTQDRNVKRRQSCGPHHAEIHRIAAEKSRIARAYAAGATPEHKYCPLCDKWLTRDKFGKNITTYDGLYGFCKECRSEFRKTKRAKRRTNKDDGFLQYIKLDAVQHGVPLDDFDNWKKCSRCHKWQPLTNYSKSRYQKTGYNCHCKECAKKDWSKYAGKYKQNLLLFS
jgi:hypothetical protein